MSEEQVSSEFLKSMGGGVVANLLFVVVYFLKRCMDKKVRHSECNSGCFRCKTDIENTQRRKKNPHDGELSEEGKRNVEV